MGKDSGFIDLTNGLIQRESAQRSAAVDLSINPGIVTVEKVLIEHFYGQGISFTHPLDIGFSVYIRMHDLVLQPW